MNTIQDLKTLLQSSRADRAVSVALESGGVVQSIQINAGELAQVLGVPIPPPPPPLPTTRKMQVSTPNGLKIRSGAGTNFGEVDSTVRAPNGTILDVFNDPPERDGEIGAGRGPWVRVRFADKGIEGWCARQFLSEPPPEGIIGITGIIEERPGGAEPARNKIGLHFLGAIQPRALDRAVALNATVYKAVDNGAALSQVHERLPNATYIYRRYEKSEDDPRAFIATNGGTPEAAANAWANWMLPIMAQFPWAYFEAFNEKDPTPELIAFEAARTRALAARGFKACVLNYSVARTGDTPDWWNPYRELVSAVIQSGSVIGLHGYAQTVMSAHYGRTRWLPDGRFEGALFPPPERAVQGITAFRVLQDVRFVNMLGVGQPLFVLTEFGLDRLAFPGNGLFGPGVDTNGWRTCIDVWRRQGWVNDSTSPEAFYRQQLAWANRVLALEPQVLGAALFTYGDQGDQRWLPFDTQTVFV